MEMVVEDIGHPLYVDRSKGKAGYSVHGTRNVGPINFQLENGDSSYRVRGCFLTSSFSLPSLLGGWMRFYRLYPSPLPPTGRTLRFSALSRTGFSEKGLDRNRCYTVVPAKKDRKR